MYIIYVSTAYIMYLADVNTGSSVVLTSPACCLPVRAFGAETRYAERTGPSGGARLGQGWSLHRPFDSPR